MSVLVIIGLLSSLVVFNLPPSETPTEKQAEALVRELNALSQQSLISGEIRAFGVTETQYGYYHYDGEDFIPLMENNWVDDIKPKLSLNGSKVKLPETLSAQILFEPTKVNTVFQLDLSGTKASYQLGSIGDGRVVLVKTQ